MSATQFNFLIGDQQKTHVRTIVSVKRNEVNTIWFIFQLVHGSMECLDHNLSWITAVRRWCRWWRCYCNIYDNLLSMSCQTSCDTCAWLLFINFTWRLNAYRCASSSYLTLHNRCIHIHFVSLALFLENVFKQSAPRQMGSSIAIEN